VEEGKEIELLDITEWVLLDYYFTFFILVELFPIGIHGAVHAQASQPILK